jgi:hypothetical protein
VLEEERRRVAARCDAPPWARVLFRNLYEQHLFDARRVFPGVVAGVAGARER